MSISFLAEAGKPKYQQVAADLKDRICGGEYLPGAALPSLAQLGEQYTVSQITVRQAVRLLVGQGLVKTVARKGLFAASGESPETPLVEERVGVLLPNIRCWSPLYGALFHDLHALGRDVLLKPLVVGTDFEAQPELAHRELNALRSTCGSGLILFGDRFLVDAFLRERRTDEAVVCLENSNGLPPTVPLVASDSFGGTFALTRHLLSLGHTRIAYHDEPFFWDPDAARMRRGTTHERRFAGYRAALRAAGLAPCMPRDLLSLLTRRAEPDPEALAGLLQRIDRPTAIVCFNDNRVRDAYERLTAAGISLPEEMSLTGYDNDSDLRGGQWLTSLDQNAPELARQLVRLLHEEREWLPSSRGGPTPMILVPPILQLRDSVAPPPAVSHGARVMSHGSQPSPPGDTRLATRAP
jgi:DNA-binding LacI/PurR family transcriptional regulator